METLLDQSQIDCGQDSSTNNYDFQENVSSDLDGLLEEIQKIDDLAALDSTQNMLLSEHYKTEAITNICRLNDEVKDELNRTKCFIKELDQLCDDEGQKIENLKGKIQIKQKELMQAKAQQVDHLDKFEFDISGVVKEFTTAPEKYQNSCLKQHTDNLSNTLEEEKSNLQKEMENVTKGEDELKKPVEVESTDLPLKVFDSGITAIRSMNQKLAQSLDMMSKEIEKLRFNNMTANFTKQTSFSKN